MLEALTRKGDGRYYFLDRPEDADEGFAKQIAGALRPAAKNVKVQVEFNPKRVGRYRLYGFEKHQLKKEDFRNDSVDAAEMAAEEAGVAIYQVETLPDGEGDIGIGVGALPGHGERRDGREALDDPLRGRVRRRLEDAVPSMKLAASAAFLGEKLKGSPVGRAGRARRAERGEPLAATRLPVERAGRATDRDDREGPRSDAMKNHKTVEPKTTMDMKAMTSGRALAGWMAAGWMLAAVAAAQDAAPGGGCPRRWWREDASVTTEIGENGGRLVVEATGLRQTVPLFFTGEARSRVDIGEKSLQFAMDVRAKVLQGKAKVLSLGLQGNGEVTRVGGPVASWSVRREGDGRFLDIVPDGAGEDGVFRFVVEGRLDDIELPREISLLRLQAGKAVSFSDTVTVATDPKLTGRLSRVAGYAPLESKEDRVQMYQSTGDGGTLDYVVERSDGLTAPAELTGLAIAGTVDEKKGSVQFVLRGMAEVRKDEVELELLRGRVALDGVVAVAGQQLRLGDDGAGNPVYRMQFDKAGRYPVEVTFVARLAEKAEWKGFDFRVPGGAVVPISLKGVGPDSEFHEQAPVVPGKEADGLWRGFLPADGNASVAWKPLRKTGEGKLFFTTTARVNVGVGAGLMRQTSEIDYKILQGELETLLLKLEGPGEVLAVEGDNVLGLEGERGGRGAGPGGAAQPADRVRGEPADPEPAGARGLPGARHAAAGAAGRRDPALGPRPGLQHRGDAAGSGGGERADAALSRAVSGGGHPGGGPPGVRLPLPGGGAQLRDRGQPRRAGGERLASGGLQDFGDRPRDPRRRRAGHPRGAAALVGLPGAGRLLGGVGVGCGGGRLGGRAPRSTRASGR